MGKRIARFNVGTEVKLRPEELRLVHPTDYLNGALDAVYLKHVVPDQMIVLKQKRPGLITKYREGVYYAEVLVKLHEMQPMSNETIASVPITLFDGEVMPFAASAILKIEMAL